MAARPLPVPTAPSARRATTGYRGQHIQHIDSFPLRGEDSPYATPAPTRPGSPTGSSDRTAREDEGEGGERESGGEGEARRKGLEGDVEKGLRKRKEGREEEEERVSPEEREWKGDVVGWDSKADPANPKNWTFRHRYLIVLLLGMTTMSSTFASSIFSSALPAVSEEFGISREVATLGISLFLCGYIVGPVIYGPVSEVFGRKLSIYLGMFIFICLSAATATAKDVQTIMITRFFGGVGASAPPAVVGGALADLFDARERATAVVVYSIAICGGPTLAPLCGSAITNSYLGWRWTEYLVLILASFVSVVGLIFVPETFAPVILTRKAKDLRFRTKRWGLHSKHEENDFSLKHFAEKTLTRPIVLLCREPMVFAICLYNSFTYGVLYLMFSAVPIIFEEEHGWTPVQASLPFLAVLVGILIAALVNYLYSAHVFAPYLDKHGSAPPEMRLPPMMLGGIVFPIGFFFLGWLPLPGKVVGLGFIGVAFLLIFQSGINYLLDAYTIYAASAVASNTFLRSIFAAALPLVAMPLYHNLGVGRACSILGAISAALMLVPFVFYKYGPKLRSMSKFAQGD
ncbi:hypothetical protein JCM10213_003891 [Rhodosporidiobolus nylandii]